jgi:hypothetical protein
VIPIPHQSTATIKLPDNIGVITVYFLKIDFVIMAKGYPLIAKTSRMVMNGYLHFFSFGNIVLN